MLKIVKATNTMDRLADVSNQRISEPQTQISHLALDIGGSLIKLVYFLRNNDGRKDDDEQRSQNNSDTSQPVLEGRLHFAKFESSKINDCLQFIRSKKLHLGAGSGDYVKGVVGLAKGLRKVKSAYPLVVAILPDVPEEHREILRSQGCIVREIEPIYPPENQVQFAMAHFVINYSKLRIWNFEEYSKMVYLDADIQVYDNIDHLLDTPNGYLYAVMDCYCEKMWSHSLQYSIGYCQQCPDKVTWPAEMGSPPPLYFNAGMFVFEPSCFTNDKLLETLHITPPTPFAEQDFLNMFFQTVYKPIPVVYNLVLAILWRHPENVELDKVKVVHYCAPGSKPWRYTGKEDNMEREDIKMLVAKWWDIYNDESLDFKAENPVSDADQTTFSKPSIMASMPGQPAISYIPAPTAA